MGRPDKLLDIRTFIPIDKTTRIVVRRERYTDSGDDILSIYVEDKGYKGYSWIPRGGIRIPTELTDDLVKACMANADSMLKLKE